MGLDVAAVTAVTIDVGKEVEKEVEKLAGRPLPDYDDLTVDQVKAKLAELDAESLSAMRSYEATHKQRVTVLRELDDALQAHTTEAAE
jgi:hypothetical protein